MKKLYSLLLLLIFVTILPAQTVWDNFEDSRKGTYGFISGTFIPYTANPFTSGNTSQVAAAYSRNPSETFDVIILDAAMADLSDYVSGTKSLSIDVWSPAAGTAVQITLENDVLAEPGNYPTGRHSVYLATTTVSEEWETISFDFVEQPDATVANDNVNRLVLLFAPNTNTSDTYYWDNLMAPELSNDPCDDNMTNEMILNDFECNQNVNYIFSHSGVNFRRIVNPDPIGNTSDFVGQYVRNGGETTDVLIGRFDGNLSLEFNSTLSIDIWDNDAPTPIKLSLQNSSNEVILEMEQSTSVSQEWQTLIFDPSEVFEAEDISQFVILFDPDTNNSDTYYFDNFQIGESVSVENLDEVSNFELSPNPVFETAYFSYDLDSKADVDIRIIDLRGNSITTIQKGIQNAGSYHINWNTNDLAPGMYFYILNINGNIGSGKLIKN